MSMSETWTAKVFSPKSCCCIAERTRWSQHLFLSSVNSTVMKSIAWKVSACNVTCVPDMFHFKSTVSSYKAPTLHASQMKQGNEPSSSVFISFIKSSLNINSQETNKQTPTKNVPMRQAGQARRPIGKWYRRWQMKAYWCSGFLKPAPTPSSSQNYSPISSSCSYVDAQKKGTWFHWMSFLGFWWLSHLLY